MAALFGIGVSKDVKISASVERSELLNMESWLVTLKEPSPIFPFFNTLKEILVSQESSYFSHNPWQISQVKIVPFGRYLM